VEKGVCDEVLTKAWGLMWNVTGNLNIVSVMMCIVIFLLSSLICSWLVLYAEVNLHSLHWFKLISCIWLFTVNMHVSVTVRVMFLLVCVIFYYLYYMSCSKETVSIPPAFWWMKKAILKHIFRVRKYDSVKYLLWDRLHYLAAGPNSNSVLVLSLLRKHGMNFQTVCKIFEQ